MLNKLLKKHLKNEEGLTLIELLVVIVILGIIAAIAVVSIGGIVKDTKDKAKVTEAIQIVNAAKLKQSAEGGITAAGWDNDALAKYISNVKEADWTVKYDAEDNAYSISGHSSVTIAAGSSATSATEQQLTTYVNEE